MALSLVTAPATEPLSLAEAKAHLRVDADDENDLIATLVIAAREYVETHTHRALITQTWDYQLDGFPATWSTVAIDARQVDSGAIWLPKPPLVSVTSLTYVDTAGVTQTWAAGNYTVDAPAGPKARPGRLVPAWSVYYPVARTVPNAVTVRFVAGYGGAALVPAMVKVCMKEHVRANWGRGTEDREEILEWIDTQLWAFKAV